MSRFRIFGLFAAAYFLSYFYRSVNAIIAPDLSQEFSLSASQLGFMSSLFFAAYAVAQIPIGVSLDRWGPRYVVPGMMMLSVAGSLIFATAQSLLMLSIGRALIGVGMASTLMGSLKAFSLWFPPHRFATAAGILMGIGSSGALAAATPLAWVSETVGWRAAFVWGALVITLSAASIAFWTRNTPPSISWPRAGATPVSLLAVFLNLSFWRIALMSLFVVGGVLAVQSLWAGPYLFDAVGLSKIAVGNMLLLMALGVVAGYVSFGWLADRFGLAWITLAGSSVFVLCQLALALGPPAVLVPFVYLLFGLSGGTATVLLSHARLVFPPAMTGRVVSAVNLFGIAGVFLLQSLIGLIVDRFPVDTAGHYPPQAYTAAFLTTTAGTLLVLIWYLPLVRRSAVTPHGKA
jgi:predicted MFS family arabinose efflux permease